jgi:hypothetical protein
MMIKKSLFVLLLSSQVADLPAQDCSKLALENRELSNQILALKTHYGLNEYADAEIKNPDENTKFKIIEIVGTKNDQSVVLKFQLLQNNKVHQKVKLVNDYDSQSKAYDEFGNEYEVASGRLGQSQGRLNLTNKLPTGVPLAGEIRFTKVLSSVTHFRLIAIEFYSKDFEDGANLIEGLIELKNVKIKWN